MPDQNEVRTDPTTGETRQWSGQRWEPIAQQGPQQPISPEHGILPSGLSTAGAMLGSFLGLPGKVLGSTIGSAANELATTVPKLYEMYQHGGGLMGPMSSEGVGAAMAAPVAHTVEDLAGNAALESIPGVAKYGLGKAAQAARAVGELPGLSTRGIVGRSAAGGLAHVLGLPTPVNAALEAGSIVAPPLARAAAPALQAASEAMPTTTSSVVRGALRALKPGVEAAEEPLPFPGGYKGPYGKEVPGFSYPEPAVDPYAPVMGSTPASQAAAEQTINARVSALSREGLRRAMANPERYRPTAADLTPNYDWQGALDARLGR